MDFTTSTQVNCIVFSLFFPLLCFVIHFIAFLCLSVTQCLSSVCCHYGE